MLHEYCALQTWRKDLILRRNIKILNNSFWNLVKTIISWIGFVSRISAWSDQNLGFLITVKFWICALFSDTPSRTWTLYWYFLGALMHTISWEKETILVLSNNSVSQASAYRESVTGSVIQATGTVELEDGLRTEVIDVTFWRPCGGRIY